MLKKKYSVKLKLLKRLKNSRFVDKIMTRINLNDNSNNENIIILSKSVLEKKNLFFWQKNIEIIFYSVFNDIIIYNK